MALPVLVTAVVVTSCTGTARAQETPWPTEGWAVSSAAAEGLDGSFFTDLDRDVRDGAYGYVDRMVVVRNGRLVVNEPYENDYREISRGHADILGCGVDACTDSSELNEYNYYHPDWNPYYQGRDVHTLQSVTKSVTSALIGIAIRRGEISGVDAPLLSFFENYDLSNIDERLHQATLADLLTMRSGIEWHETDRPVDKTNTTVQLEASDDWIQFTLDQPMDAAPGEKWAYNSGGSHLMSGIIRQATGSHSDEYAEQHLFGPLGISDYHWKKTPTGYSDTEGGLYLEAEQLAKIGYLYLQDGIWEGERILPEGWVEASTSRRVDDLMELGWGYGYQWWRTDRDGVEVWAALGFGGQYLMVLPEHDLIGVVTGWNVFGGDYPSVGDALLGAMLSSVGEEAARE